MTEYYCPPEFLLNDPEVPSSMAATRPRKSIPIKIMKRSRKDPFHDNYDTSVTLTIYNRNVDVTPFQKKTYRKKLPVGSWEDVVGHIKRHGRIDGDLAELRIAHSICTDLIRVLEGGPYNAGTASKLNARWKRVVGLYRNGVAYGIGQHELIMNDLIKEGYDPEVLGPNRNYPVGESRGRKPEFILLHAPPKFPFQNWGDRIHVTAETNERLKKFGFAIGPDLLDGKSWGLRTIRTASEEQLHKEELAQG
ncbi:hypothetical protein BJ508DRAFT_311774 [Ascobolus immersus RN42]|uniref:Uncharacterized protein n=1 Tax=Ascobolus immersus RN42 TaxID=1160509 RepID=A0A3N4HPD3_ASCIM|nr:hypothetical protein BJ508DRAFT_311774 [Ascobolus immersus RN42]